MIFVSHTEHLITNILYHSKYRYSRSHLSEHAGTKGYSDKWKYHYLGVWICEDLDNWSLNEWLMYTTALTPRCGCSCNTSSRSFSLTGAGCHTNDICDARAQSTQCIGTPKCVVLYDPVLCTWTLRYIAYLIMVRKEREMKKVWETERGMYERKEGTHIPVCSNHNIDYF